MNNDEERIIEGFKFDSEEEFDIAKKEWETIGAIEKKLPLGDAKYALRVYNNAVSKESFKTVIGYAFLSRLRSTIISCGLVKDENLNPIPVENREQDNKKSNYGGKGNSMTDSRYKLLYEHEKSSKTVYKIVVTALIAIIIAMFCVSLSSKYSFVTYFTDYEENIRNEIIDEYEAWQTELEEREKALKDAGA